MCLAVGCVPCLYLTLRGSYIALAGTVETPPGATPDANFDNSYVHGQAVESAIWSYDPLTQILAPDWINTNGGEPQPDIIWGAGYRLSSRFCCALTR